MTIKRILTKADVDLLKETFATKNDLTKLESRIDQKLDDQTEKFENIVTKFKDDFYTKIDPVLKEIKTNHEERIVQSDHIKTQGDRIETLEKIHPQGRHLAVAYN